MSATATAPGFKPKKSVALSGVVAGSTALCTVGRTGNDLHYRGYNILEIAEACEFEEIAYLLVHGKLPTLAELTAYKRKLRGLRELPPSLRAVLELLPAATHPMDVMRTAVSMLGLYDPAMHLEATPEINRQRARSITAKIAVIAAYFHRARKNLPLPKIRKR